METRPSWLLTITVLAAAVSNPVLGRLGDQFGLRRVLVWTVGAFTLGSAVCTLSDAFPVLLAGRALQGVGTAAIPLGIGLIDQLVAPQRRPAGIALVSAMLGVGGAAGLPAAGAVAEAWGLPGLFAVAAAAGAVAVCAVVWLVPEPIRVPVAVPIDVWGGLLLTSTLLALLLPLTRGAQWGWASPITICVAVAGAATTAAFVVVELRRRAPMVDLRTAAQRTVLLTNTASLLIGFAMFASFLGTIAVLQAPTDTGYGFGLSVTKSALWQLPSGLLMVVLAPVAARLIARRGPRPTLLGGALLMCAGFAVRLWLDETVMQVVACTVIISVGTAVAYSAMPALVLDAAPEGAKAAGTGLNALARTMGTAVCSAVFGALAGAAVHPPASAVLLFFVLATLASAGAAALVAAIRH